MSLADQLGAEEISSVFDCSDAMTTAKEKFHNNITLKPQRKQKRTSLRQPSNDDRKNNSIHISMSQQPIQSQPVTLAPATQPTNIPTQAALPALAPAVSVPYPDFDGNDPVMNHPTTAKGPRKKRLFEDKDQRDEVLQP